MSTHHSHSHGRHNIEREESRAPILSLQDEYRRELEGRFTELRGVLRETISENDALGLSRTNIEPREEFEYDQRPAKQIEFQKQLEKWISAGILEPASEKDIEEGRHYTAVYVEAAYKKGLEWADGQLEGTGSELTEPDDYDELLGRPIHTDTLEILYSRNYEGLEDINDDMAQSIRSELTEAFMQGWNPRKAANNITKEVEDIQRKRARTLVRTEIMNAQAQGSINRYREARVEEVEILTHDPCEICRPIGVNDPYPIDDIPMGGPPFHPNCICVVAPVV